MRPWLKPLVPLYRAGLSLQRGFSGTPRRLRGRVVSVGSLSAGGAGKTPVVMMVVELLRGAGFAVSVLSRGYGREGKEVELVEVAGSAGRFGDEPMLMARRLGVPVWVGADRYAAGVAAEADAADGLVHVLDDGFQHRQLGRDVDMVLLTRQDVEDDLLPAGNLREDLAALGRADVVVLREEEARGLREMVPMGKAVWVVRRVLAFEDQLPEKVVVFCGLARPEGFLKMLKEVGVTGAGVVTFRDHHRYEMRDMEMLAGMARLGGAGGFCTTEKDAVKLREEMWGVLEAVGPVFVAELEMELVEGSVEDLLRRLR